MSVSVDAAFRTLAPSVIPFAAIDRGRWDELIGASTEGWLYQYSSWIEWTATLQEANLSFGIADANGRLLLLMPLYMDRPHANRFIRLRRVHTGVSGPAARADLSPSAHREAWRSAIVAAERLSVALGGDVLQVRCSMTAPAHWPGHVDPNKLFAAGISAPIGVDPFHPPSVLSRFVDLGKTDEELLLDMAPNARAAVRQSLRTGLTLSEATSAGDLKRYHAIHVHNWNRTGLSPHSQAYFERAWQLLRPVNAIRVLFARIDGKDVAGMVLHVHKGAALYWAGSSLEEHQRLRPNNFLVWQAMRLLRSEGVRWLELGTYDVVESVSHKEHSVGRFKERFGSIAVRPLEAQRVYRPAKLLVASMLRETRSALRRVRD